MRVRTSVLLSGVLLTACTGSPAKPSFLGSLLATTYTGVVSDSASGTGSVRVTLTPVNNVLSGSVEMSFAGNEVVKYVMVGEPSGSSYTATMDLNAPFDTNCRLDFAGSVTGQRFSGRYASVRAGNYCVDRAGTIDAAAQ